jgi:ELWxxDGT repeat protein
VSALLGASLPSAAGTAELLADLNQTPSFGSGNAGVFEPLIPVGDRVVFPAFEPSSGEELWGSDGTPLGTRLLRDVEPGGESSQYRGLGTVRQTALVLRDVGFGSGPWDLWRSDGTAAGTVPIAGLTELEPCAFRASTPEGVNLGNRFLFLAYSSGRRTVRRRAPA